MQVWVNKDNKDYGPYNLAELQKYVEEGSIDSIDSVCQVGATKWDTVGNLLPQFSSATVSENLVKTTEAPVAQAAADNSFVESPLVQELTAEELKEYYNQPFCGGLEGAKSLFGSTKELVDYFTKGEKLLAMAPGELAAGRGHWFWTIVIVAIIILIEVIDIPDPVFFLLLLVFIPWYFITFIISINRVKTGLLIVTSHRVLAFQTVIKKSSGNVHSIKVNEIFHAGRGQLIDLKYIGFPLKFKEQYLKIIFPNNNLIQLTQQRFSSIHKNLRDSPTINQQIDPRLIVRIDELRKILIE